ncbi:MAG TPA: sigma 54-interacting transcriptional regulator, partial [Candidatus Kryptonia bacterium]|nr:sigma 54-interacting transcriptional regulator [Candidatus Kryptonia bacterium]
MSERLSHPAGALTLAADGTAADALLAGENRLLEMIACGEPLAVVLDRLCRLVEEIAAGSLASILLFDASNQTVRHGAAPSLPRAYTDAIDGAVVGPSAGSCGTAAYRNEPVIVSDITSDPLWADYRHLALAHGLRACWSMPIRSAAGDVLGTFAIYSRAPRKPTAAHYRLIEQIAHVASIAIARARTAEELQRSEAELRQLIDFVPQHIIVLGPDGRRLHANKVSLDYTGHTLEEFLSPEYDHFIHPDDLERIKSGARHIADGAPFEMEGRLRGKDGRYRWFLLRCNPLRDAQGRIGRWYATGTDINDRKQAEERVHRENIALRDEVDKTSMFEEIVGASPALQAVLSRVAKVAPTESTVLITGETGTGKELIARAIHKRSARAAHAFVSVNCAGIPQSLIASELFGHEKGAFTGALQRRLGRF